MAQQLIQGLKSADNTIRKQAEAEVQSAASTNPSQLLASLLTLMQQDANEVEFISILIQNTLFTDDIFKKLSNQEIQGIVQIAATHLVVDNKLSFLKRMCDLVVKAQINNDAQMMTLLLQIASAASTINLKQATMYYVEIMCEFAFDDALLLKNADVLNQIFVQFLGDSEPLVRVAALKGMTIFLASIEEDKVLKQFENAAPTLVQKCTEAITIEQTSAVSAVQSINELLEHHPKFLKNVHGDLLQLYTQLMTFPNLIADIRKAALHGLQTLSASAPAFIRKSDNFKTQTIVGIMQMLTEVDNNDWESTLEDNCLQLNDISSAAEDCLGKMVKDIGTKYLLPLFVPLIMVAIQSTKSNEQHAGLVAMSTLSDGAAEHFKSELPNIMGMILPLANSADKRVIYDVLSCIAMLCQEFTPEIQKLCGQPVLQLIVNCMQQTTSQKVQYIAIACLVDFTRDLVDDKETTRTVLAPVATQLIEQLWKIIESNLNGNPTAHQQEVAQQGLSALSALAQSLKEHFTQYYDVMMPVLMRLIQNTKIENIKGLLVECIGCILTSISDSRSQQFKQDADQLIKLYLDAQMQLEVDDQQHQALFFFYTQVASALKYDFGIYLERIFPLVERALKIDVGFAVNSEVESKNVAKVKLDLKFLGLKSLSLNTSALEQKIEAAHTLVNLIEYCGKSYLPYAQQTIPLITEFITYKHSADIQKSMSKCVQYLMMACNNDTEMAQIINKMTPILIKELDHFLKTKQFNRAATLAEDIAECITLLKHAHLTKDNLELLLNASQSCMQAICKEKESLTYEDEEQFEQECEDIDELMGHIVNITTEFIKLYPVEPFYIQNLMPHFYKFFNTKSTKDQVVNAISFFNIVLPYSSEELFQRAYPEIAKLYLGISKSADLEMKQNLLFGFGNFAKRTTQLDVSQVVELAKTIIDSSDCKSADKAGAYETAITTIGKVGMYQSLPASSEMINKFLQSLPHSYQDAQETHLMLIKEINSGNAALLANKDQVIETLQRIKSQDSNNPENELLCDEGRQLISQLV